MSLTQALIKRIENTGDTSPGQFNLVADVVNICAGHMDAWTNRTDDAVRIPDVLDETARHLREEARNHA